MFAQVVTFSIYNMYSCQNQDSMILVFEVFNNLFFKFVLIYVIHFIFPNTVESEIMFGYKYQLFLSLKFLNQQRFDRTSFMSMPEQICGTWVNNQCCWCCSWIVSDWWIYTREKVPLKNEEKHDTQRRYVILYE